MKRAALFIIAVLFLISGAGNGNTKDIGLGIIAGEPTGLSVKKWVDGRSAFDGALAWSFVDGASFQMHIDYLRHRYDMTERTNDQLPFYYGVGGRIALAENGKKGGDDRIGVRIPIGLAYMFRDEPVDIFIELAPILDIAPKTEFNLNGAVGVRLYLR